MIEIQEPTDFAVRYEFERAGYVLPEAARFMGRGVDFGLSMIDFARYPRDVIERNHRLAPRHLRSLGVNSWQDELIGPQNTPCFRVRKTHLGEPVTKTEDSFYIGIVTEGACTATVGGETFQLNCYDKFFCPAGLGGVRFEPQPRAAIVECFPPL
jgi:mannose-6-phosphate isomerase